MDGSSNRTTPERSPQGDSKRLESGRVDRGYLWSTQSEVWVLSKRGDLEDHKHQEIPQDVASRMRQRSQNTGWVSIPRLT